MRALVVNWHFTLKSDLTVLIYSVFLVSCKHDWIISHISGEQDKSEHSVRQTLTPTFLCVWKMQKQAGKPHIMQTQLCHWDMNPLVRTQVSANKEDPCSSSQLSTVVAKLLVGDPLKKLNLLASLQWLQPNQFYFQCHNSEVIRGEIIQNLT